MKAWKLASFALLFACVSMNATALLAAADQELVLFRLTQSKRVHLHDAEKADKIADNLKKIGCEVDVEKHGDHIDIEYSCPKWKTIKLKSHSDAHKWQEWLDKLGFETHHKH